MFGCKRCGGKTRVTGHARTDIPNTIRYRRCDACGHTFVTAEMYEWEYKGEPEPSDVRWERRRWEKIRIREERAAEERKKRDFCRSTDCLECPRAVCYEDLS